MIMRPIIVTQVNAEIKEGAIRFLFGLSLAGEPLRWLTMRQMEGLGFAFVQIVTLNAVADNWAGVALFRDTTKNV